MQTRTRLTTPPGQEPAPTDASPREAPERYTPGLGLPTEPVVPGRHRRKVVTLVTLAVLVLAGYVTLRILTSGQFQDPALTDDSSGTVEEVEDPTLQVPSEDATGG